MGFLKDAFSKNGFRNIRLHAAAFDNARNFSTAVKNLEKTDAPTRKDIEEATRHLRDIRNQIFFERILKRPVLRSETADIYPIMAKYIKPKDVKAIFDIARTLKPFSRTQLEILDATSGAPSLRQYITPNDIDTLLINFEQHSFSHKLVEVYASEVPHLKHLVKPYKPHRDVPKWLTPVS